MEPYSNGPILWELVLECQMNELKRIFQRWRVDFGVELLTTPVSTAMME